MRSVAGSVAARLNVSGINVSGINVSGIIVICIIVCSSTLAIAQDASSSTDSSAEQNSPADTVSVDNVTDDERIRERLEQILDAAADEGWFEETQVKTNSGIVTLKGMAANDKYREWAGNTARRVQDVIAVVNEIKVDDTVDLQTTREVVEESLDALRIDFLQRSPLLAAGILMVFLTGVVSKLVGWVTQRVLDQRRMRTSLKDLIYQLTSLAIWVIGLMIATVIAFPGMTPAKALTVLGLGSVAIGFAFKDIFENFFAGILILWRYPFDRGDFITCDDLTGKVEQITIRNTMIRRLDGELAVVPNATIFKSNLDVLTSQPQRRVRIICGVAYGENVDESREVIEKAVQSCDTVQGKRTVEVFANEFASSSINFEVAWWTGSKPIDIRRSRDEVIGAIKRDLDQAGIEIPFPYRTLTFKDPEIAQSITDRRFSDK